VLILFGLALFVSAFLLFWVQLMVAKMILPLLGGSPSVWNTCLFFFQATLLLGYGYAYLASQGLKAKQQIWLHGLILLLPLPLLPIALKHWLPPADANPISWLLGLLVIEVGLPFFVVATSAPLLQQWFAQADHPDSADPYFLYAASNAGSLLGLLSYPFVIEPNLTLYQQSWGWAIAYVLLAVLILTCGLCLWRQQAPVAQLSTSLAPDSIDKLPTRLQQWGWVLLSFLPSSLLLGTTTYLTTDIAAIPLLWAVPLALYLLTFILAFARRPLIQPQQLVDILPLIITPLVILLLLKVTQPTVIVLPLHLLGLLMIAYVLHGYLAASRPGSQYLTRFYLLISLGGVLGGLLNAIAAPLLFSTVLEYPLVLILSLLLLPSLPTQSKSRLRTTFPLAVGLLLGALLIGWRVSGQDWLGTGLGLGLLGAIAYGFSFKPWRWGVGCLIILLLGQFSITSLGGVLTTERSFFGVYQVLQDNVGKYNTLLHGTTVHGRQSFDPARQQEPLTYFTRSGPIGQVLTARQFQQVAVLGLGVGTLATYAQPGQTWDFYEIDPLVVKLAQDQRYFTFLAQAAVPLNLVLGDARLRLAQSVHPYDLIVMDAFSSDAIPVHLITQEAMQLYLSKLTARGLIAVNITNRYLNLEPVLAGLAQHLGLFAIKRQDLSISESEIAAGKSASRWVVIAQHRQDLAFLTQDQRWQMISAIPNTPVWTDHFSNLVQVLRRD
jgi:spermidine synthase